MKTTNRTPIRLLPLALLLTVISICLTVLAILTFSTAGADLRLAEKYAETVRTRYELACAAGFWMVPEGKPHTLVLCELL